MCGVTSHSIRVDRNTEFINRDLETWCHERGMTIEKTAPYSPSQNGVAERMNRALVELARSMLTASKLPEFLWEPAVAHAVYLRNRAYTPSLDGRTPCLVQTKAERVPFSRIWHTRMDRPARANEGSKDPSEIDASCLRWI